MLTRLEMWFSSGEDVNVKLASTKNSLCQEWHASQLSTRLLVFGYRTNHPLIGSSIYCFMCSLVHRWYIPFRLQALQFRLQAAVRLLLPPLTTVALAICPSGQKTGTWQNKSVTAQCAKNSEKRIWTNTEQADRLSWEIVWKTPASKSSNSRHVQNKKTEEKQTTPELESVITQKKANNAAKSWV